MQASKEYPFRFQKVHCPPGIVCISKIVALKPFIRPYIPAASPPIPAPIIAIDRTGIPVTSLRPQMGRHSYTICKTVFMIKKYPRTAIKE